MEAIFSLAAKLALETVQAVFTSLSHNVVPLSLAIITAVLMNVYIDTEKMKAFMLRRSRVSVLASVLLGALTPLCACGTTAVVIGLLTTTLPWGPIMAFLTSSPLMSPDGFIMLAGVVSLRFAVALLVASIVMGLGAGFATGFIEKKTGFLKDQTRFADKTENHRASCGCDSGANVPSPVACRGRANRFARSAGCDCADADEGVWKLPSLRLSLLETGCCGVLAIDECQSTGPAESFSGWVRRVKIDKVGAAFVNIGLKQILPFFSLFVAIGYLVNAVIPTDFIMGLFSSDTPFAVPLAAAVGLPLYVSGEAAVPLIAALMKAGAGEGAMLAFMITGQATSAWVIAGLATFMKRRAVGLYLAYIVAGGIGLGYLYGLILRFL